VTLLQPYVVFQPGDKLPLPIRGRNVGEVDSTHLTEGRSPTQGSAPFGLLNMKHFSLPARLHIRYLDSSDLIGRFRKNTCSFPALESKS